MSIEEGRRGVSIARRGVHGEGLVMTYAHLGQRILEAAQQVLRARELALQRLDLQCPRRT